MSKATKTKPKLEEKLEQIKLLTKIANLESCLHIYCYLLLYGQTTPAKLREITGLSKATMFRNLALLSSAGILDKEELESATDRRYSLHYHIEKDMLKAMKALYSKDVEGYARNKGMARVIEDYGLALEGLPLELNRICNELIVHCPEESLDEDTCLVVKKMLTFHVGEAGSLASLVNDIRKVVNAFQSEISRTSRNMKKPLERPVVISISLATTEIDETPIPDDAIALKRK